MIWSDKRAWIALSLIGLGAAALATTASRDRAMGVADGSKSAPSPRPAAEAKRRAAKNGERSPERHASPTPKAAEAASGESTARATRPARGQVVVRAPWGSDVGALGKKRPSEAAPEAPMSFAIDEGGRVHVLDQLNARIQTFAAGEPTRVTSLPSDTFQDLEVMPNGSAVALDRLATKTIAFVDPQGSLDHTVPIEGPNVPEGGGVTGLFARADGVWLEVEHTNLVRLTDASGTPDPERPVVPGRFSRDGASFLRAAVTTPTSVAVLQAPVADPERAVETALSFPMPVLGLHALDSDARGRVYVVANLVREREAAPFEVEDEREVVVVLDRGGRELGRVDIAPPQGPEEQFRTVRIGNDGAIYELVCGEDAATVERFAL